MGQRQLYGIGIYEEAILLSDFTGKHEKRFVVDEQELMKLFRFNRTVTLKPFEGLVSMEATLDGEETFLVTLKRSKRKIIYHVKDEGVTLKHLNIEMPNTLVRAQVRDNIINITSLWAYKGKLTKKTELFELALPNIGGTDLCQGGAYIKVNGNVMKAIEDALFETPFNHHRHLVSKEDLPFLEYFDKYKGKMPFKTLRKLGHGRQLLED